MTREPTAKVRVVRCPKCSELLPEIADVPVYKCGGCGTVLQAKKRQNEMKTQKPEPPETGLTQMNEMKRVSGDIESSSSTREAILPPRELHSLDEVSQRDQNEASSPAELTHHGIEESSLPVKVNSVVNEDIERDQDSRAPGSDDCELNLRERSSVVVSSNALTFSSILEPEQFQESAINHLDGAKSTDGMESMASTEPSSELSSKNLQDEMVNGKPALQEAVLSKMNEMEHVSRDIESSSSSQVGLLSKGQCTLAEIPRNNQNEAEDYTREQCAATDLSDEASSSSSSALHGKEDSSLPVVHENNEMDHEFKGPGPDDCAVETKERSSMVASENISSDTLRSLSNLEPKQSQEGATRRAETVNPSSELSSMLRDLSNSSTTGSYHKYDGSVSSCDGIEVQVPDRHLHQPKTFEAVGFADPEKWLKGDKHPVNDNSRKEHHTQNTFSIPLHNKKNHDMKRGRYDRSWMRLERDEFHPRPLLHTRSTQAGYEVGCPSTHGSDEFQYSSNFQSPDKYDFDEQDRMKLLRMVWELRGQLSERDALKEKVSGTVPAPATWKEKQIPPYHRESVHASNCSHCCGRCGLAETFPQQHNFPRRAFSGEAASIRQQVDRSCLHCCPHDWRWSLQLFPQCVCCDKGQIQATGGHSSYSVYSSTPSSPLHTAESEFLPGRYSMKSGEQRHQDNRAVNSHSREEILPVKKHLLPVAGGAPFIMCYCCLKLLQLPADFLLFRKRRHRLRCSACSEVLNFSLENRTRIVPHTSKSPIVPPPTEVDDCSDTMNHRSLASMSHGKSCGHAELMSCSDDYGRLSFCKSCSTDDKYTPIFQGNADNKKMVSNTDAESKPMGVKKENPVLGHSENESRNTVETNQSARTSTHKPRADAFSSEIEELQPTSSPLHRLMGYSSATEVINGQSAKKDVDYADKSPELAGRQI